MSKKERIRMEVLSRVKQGELTVVAASQLIHLSLRQARRAWKRFKECGDAEIQKLSSHFAGVLRGDHPCHLAIWGKAGTGKTLTLSYFLNLLAELACARNVPVRHEHLYFATPRPCFRALNDLACLLGASKRYKKGISLEELMLRIDAN